MRTGKRILWLQLGVALSILTALCPPVTADAFVFGVNADNWSGQIRQPAFAEALKSMGVQFVVWHLSPEEEAAPERLGEIVRFCRQHRFQYLFNTELVNYAASVARFSQADGTYRWDLTPATLEALREDPLFLGVVYDEPMLMQALNGVRMSNRLVLPYFIDSRGLSAAAAYDAVVKKIDALAGWYRSYGKRLVVEEVLPDYAHAAARGGAILAPKLLKETYNDLMFFVYAGAARQYGQQELWACVDLWFLDRFPFQGRYGSGYHTPESLREALRDAYAWGFDYVYIEHMKALVDEAFALTAYGRAVVDFQRDKVKSPKGNWSALRPEYLVKRFPGGYWGQRYSAFIPDHPYGSWVDHPELVTASLSWLQWLNRLSGGRIPPEANTWNATNHPFFSQKPYAPRAGLPPLGVVDHLYKGPPGVPKDRFIDLTMP